jgi:hypothetical protein
MTRDTASRRLVVVRLSSERARQELRQNCSSAKAGVSPALVVVAGSERLMEIAGGDRIRAEAGGAFVPTNDLDARHVIAVVNRGENGRVPAAARRTWRIELPCGSISQAASAKPTLAMPSTVFSPGACSPRRRRRARNSASSAARSCTRHDGLVCGSGVPVELRVTTRRLAPPHLNVRKSSLSISSSSPIWSP